MREKVNGLLKEYKAILIRQKNHEIWKLPNGKIFVRPKTLSDNYRGDYRSYSDLRRLLELPIDKKEKSVRANKRIKQRREELPIYKKSINHSLAEKLSITGIAENILKEENRFLSEQNKLLTEELNEKCWFCLFKNWIYDKL